MVAFNTQDPSLLFMSICLWQISKKMFCTQVGRQNPCWVDPVSQAEILIGHVEQKDCNISGQSFCLEPWWRTYGTSDVHGLRFPSAPASMANWPCARNMLGN
uniref:Uncharacterized protein n=1 Tax=Sphaerodactylus townsendi TaxID=933632 RepID=A0ACB8EJD5_9SAUR